MDLSNLSWSEQKGTCGLCAERQLSTTAQLYWCQVKFPYDSPSGAFPEQTQNLLTSLFHFQLQR